MTKGKKNETRKEVKSLDGENELLKAQLARALADYDNLKRRSDEEKISLLKFSSQNIIVRLLPILDMLEKAQEHLKDQGLAIAVLEFKRIFDEEGLKEISPKKGAEFDENIMEVIEVEESEDNNIKEGQVTGMVLPGWRFEGGGVVRHAKVKVRKD